MPKISAKTKHYYRGRVRSMLVQNPQISGQGIKRQLEQQGLVLDRHYINSLVSQIHAERVKPADTWVLNLALASFEDAMSEIARVGWEIPACKNLVLMTLSKDALRLCMSRVACRRCCTQLILVPVSIGPGN